MTIDTNELRRKVNSTDIVDHIDLHANIKPFLSELLNRLEAAESTRRDDYQNWMTALDRNAELLAKLEAAEKERAMDEECIADLMTDLNRVGHENDALRAKITEMERQEPVAWLHESRRDSDVVTDAVKHVWGKVAVGSMAAYSIPLYALPGAKGE